MKNSVKICLLILLVISIIGVLYFLYKKSIQNKTAVDSYKKLLIRKRTNLSCNVYLPSKSHGLVLDSIIVCNKTKNLPAKPNFIFEDFDTESSPNEFLFINLDTSFINKLYDEDSPHYLMCKTNQAYSILKRMFPSKEVAYVGFTSFDRMKEGFEMDYNKFIHICGKSPFKGTLNTIKVWIKNPQFPVLKVICNSGYEKYMSLIEKENCTNIEIITDFINEEQIDELYNTYGIHICPSIHEGWGHYIAEAKSCKAVVLYTNAPSMNETFTDGSDGIAIPCNNEIEDYSHNGICPLYKVTVEQIETAVKVLLQIPIEKRKEIGNNAREKFLKNDTDFQYRLIENIKGSKKIPKQIHRIWIDKNEPLVNSVLPDKYNKYITVWKDYNNDFTHKIWSGKQILELIQQNFPQYINFYLNLTPFIKKCDFARFIIVYVHGGFYCDIDFYCKRNISYITDGGENYFVREPKEHYIEDSEMLCNGFFGACANNEFVLGWIQNMVENHDVKDVLRHTGPIALDNYSKITKHKMLLGNTCDILSVISSFKLSSECDNYDYDIATLWFDGTDWDEFGTKRNNDKVKVMVNPIDNTDIIWDIEDQFEMTSEENVAFIDLFDKAKKLNSGGIIIYRAYSGFGAIALAMALKKIGKPNIIVYAFETEKSNCELIQKASILNIVSNIIIIRNDFINQSLYQPVDDTNITSWNDFATNKKQRRLYYTPDNLFNKNKLESISIIYITENATAFLQGCQYIIATSNPIIIK
jgi:mannosyltransferase OCH1-like enzyme